MRRTYVGHIREQINDRSLSQWDWQCIYREYRILRQNVLIPEGWDKELKQIFNPFNPMKYFSCNYYMFTGMGVEDKKDHYKRLRQCRKMFYKTSN